MKLSIKLKILLSFLTVICLVTLIFLISTEDIISESQREHLELQIAKAQQNTSTFIKETRDNLTKEIKLVGQLPTLTNVIDGGSAETVKDSTSTLIDKLNVSFIIVYDVDEEFLSSTETLNEGEDLSKFNAFATKAIEGESGSFITVLNNKVAIVAFAPVGLEDDPSGAIFSGQFIEKQVLETIKAFIDMDISLMINESLSSTTNTVIDHTNLKAAKNTNGLKTYNNFIIHNFSLRDEAAGIADFILFYPLENHKKLIKKLQQKMIFIGVIAILIASVIIYFISSQITKPIRTTVLLLKEIASGEGDLTQRLTVKTKDETGELAFWFNKFITTIQEIIVNIHENTIKVSSRTSEISTLADQVFSQSESINNETDKVKKVSSNVVEQVALMSNSARSMSTNTDEVATSINNTAVHMKNTTGGIEETSKSIKIFEESSLEMMEMINSISEKTSLGSQAAEEAVITVNTATDNVSHLADSSDKIETIIQIIEEIANQTQNLALNATIEAARAGEAGKGFAVVANEVKELAKQTNKATEDIRENIQRMQTSTDTTVNQFKSINTVISNLNKVVLEIAESISGQKTNIEKNSQLTVKTADSLTSIKAQVIESHSFVEDSVKVIQEVSTRARDVNDKSEMTSRSINEVIQNVNTISSTVNQSKASAADISKSTSELAQMATSLNSLVEQFKV